jgi:ubiquinol-cytochrome c reductase cytochrome b subunit
MEKSNVILSWVDKRFPLTELWNDHIAKYYAPKKP